MKWINEELSVLLSITFAGLFFIILVTGALYLDYSNDQAIIQNCNKLGGKLINVKGTFVCETNPPVIGK